MDGTIENIVNITKTGKKQEYLQLLRKTIPKIENAELYKSLNKEELLILKGLEIEGKNRIGMIKCINKKIKPKSKNEGEKGEFNSIKNLIDIKNDKEKIFQIFGIESKIELIDPSNNEIIADKNLIKKSSGYFKADIIIDFVDVSKKYNISIKCNDGSSPTLLNHTNRACDYFQNKLSSEKLKIFDSVMSKRKNIKKQDVPFKIIKDQLNDEEIECLIEVISYFTFDGTGSKQSSCPADSILIVGNSSDILSTGEFIDCREKQNKIKYVKSILPKLRICMRSGPRGGPGKKNHEEKMKLCEPWLVCDTKDKPCMALHIRFI